MLVDGEAEPEEVVVVAVVADAVVMTLEHDRGELTDDDEVNGDEGLRQPSDFGVASIKSSFPRSGLSMRLLSPIWSFGEQEEVVTSFRPLVEESGGESALFSLLLPAAEE